MHYRRYLNRNQSNLNRFIIYMKIKRNLYGLYRYFSDQKTEIEIPTEELTLDQLNKSASSFLTDTPEETNFPEPPSASFSYKILGKEFQAAEISLDPGQKILTRASSLAYMTDAITFNTSLKGGISDSLLRSMGGSSTFLVEFANESSALGKLLLTPRHPAKVIAINMPDYNGQLICHKDSFLCGDHEGRVTATYNSSIMSGYFSGEGFILQRLEGKGVNLLAGGGVVMRKTLRKDEELKLSPGSILAFDSRVQIKVAAVKGINNILFGQGLFFVILKGPGDVLIQSLSFQKLAHSISSRIQKSLNRFNLNK
jgi:uncharacterized protein (TIGR00266 family)